ncbi:hypothetical protein A4G18_04830 [Pasteurellaceae bacterium Pebbles2]|nr:hypothetical protein [Pasteurellaceae bacterium Pebbles2]
MTFPLFETICIEQGEIKNIHLHQQRYERTLQQFYVDKNHQSAVKIHDLFESIKKTNEFSTAVLTHKLIRCRVGYNHQTLEINFFPYERKSYQRFQPVICDQINYALKFQNRRLLNELLTQKGNADEIIIIKQGKVSDCSIGNLIFRQGSQWFTPNTPLLKGTQREHLLQIGKIKEKTIFAEDIHQFDEIRLINAMNSLD